MEAPGKRVSLYQQDRAQRMNILQYIREIQEWIVCSSNLARVMVLVTVIGKNVPQGNDKTQPGVL